MSRRAPINPGAASALSLHHGQSLCNRLLEKKQQRRASRITCLSCSSPCLRTSGFALSVDWIQFLIAATSILASFSLSRMTCVHLFFFLLLPLRNSAGTETKVGRLDCCSFTSFSREKGWRKRKECCFYAKQIPRWVSFVAQGAGWGLLFHSEQLKGLDLGGRIDWANGSKWQSGKKDQEAVKWCSIKFLEFKTN